MDGLNGRKGRRETDSALMATKEAFEQFSIGDPRPDSRW